MELNLGKHLLGRIHEPDERDWQMADVLPLLADTLADDLLDKTIREVILDTPWLSSWRGILAFWRWLKTVLGSVQPVPVPIPPTPPAPVSKTWADPIQLDQGQTPHCVGFGWAGWGDSDPIQDTYANPDAHDIYYEAKVIDGQPRRENGSSVRSGAKALQNRSRLANYAFAHDTDSITNWVLSQGPVVVGSDWTSDMFDPDADGYVRPTGPVEGGHCYLLLGYLAEEDAYLFQNSWGVYWGLDGRFKMRVADFATLLANDGEACAGLELPL